MKNLKFKPHLIKLILNKTKTVTWRVFDEKNIIENDKIIFINSDSGEEFAKAVVTLVAEKLFCELTEEDWHGHEKFDSENEMYKTYSQDYKQPIDKNTSVKIIHFQLL